MPRKQLPTYSPVTAGALLAGARALLGDGARARARVEALVRAEHAPRGVLLCDSGTTALTLALAAAVRRAAANGRAPVVALPAYACFDLATAAVGADCRVTFYDLDPATLGPDWPTLERALADGAAAVVAAHLYGVPVDVPRLRTLAESAGAVVVDDAAQGVGAALGGRPVGTHGSLGVLSFGRGKGRTGGSGGALLANDARGEELLREIAQAVTPPARGAGTLAKLAAQWVLGRPSLYPIPASLPFLGLGETPYHAPDVPSGLPAASAAALAANWAAAMAEVATRRRVAAAWRPACEAAGWAIPSSDATGAEPGWLRLPALVPAPLLGTEVAARVERGIMPAYPQPLPTLPVLSDRAVRAARWPGAETLVARLVTLPCHRHARPLAVLPRP